MAVTDARMRLKSEAVLCARGLVVLRFVVEGVEETFRTIKISIHYLVLEIQLSFRLSTLFGGSQVLVGNMKINRVHCFIFRLFQECKSDSQMTGDQMAN